MEKRRVINRTVILFLVIMLFACVNTTYAMDDYREPTYKCYTYNAWGEAVPTANTYIQRKEFGGLELGIGAFKEPSDIFYSKGKIYIVDKGNNRIVVTDEGFRNVSVIDMFRYNGNDYTLKGPTGIFVDRADNIYIADRDNNKIIKSDLKGNISLVIDKPNSNIYDENVDFLPTRIVVDYLGNIYVQATNIYQGLMEFDKDGKFKGYFGSNDVEVTFRLLVDRLWKGILSKEQKSAMLRYVPIEYTNIDIDKRGFIYTTCTSQNSLNEIKKLNPKGDDVLRKKRPSASKTNISDNFGDLEVAYIKAVRYDTTFVDIAVDDNNIFYGLDSQRGRIFQYSPESFLISVFGDTGQQVGNMVVPTAIEVFGDKLCVLDSAKAKIILFERTGFGKKINKALDLYNKGLYVESYNLWKDIANENINCELAYIGMGKALVQMGSFKEAMRNFKLAYDRENYSKAFKEYRAQVLRENFSLLMIGIVLLVAFIVWVLVRKNNEENSFYTWDINKPWKNMLYAMKHPFKGYEEMKIQKKWSVKFSLLVILLFFVSSVFKYGFYGFQFNYFGKPEDINILMLLINIIQPMILWSITNWAICSLMEGEGTFREIWVASVYSKAPLVLSIIPLTLLSMVLTQEEGMFLQVAYYILDAWCLFLLYASMMSVHQYTPGKTVVTMVLTKVGIVLIQFMGVLVFSLFQQMYIFGETIVKEILFRLG